MTICITFAAFDIAFKVLYTFLGYNFYICGREQATAEAEAGARHGLAFFFLEAIAC